MQDTWKRMKNKKLFDNRRGDELDRIQLVGEGATNDYYEEDGWTALHWACLYGKDKLVLKILEKYPEQIETKTASFNTPINYTFRQYHIAELLLKKCAKNAIWNILNNSFGTDCAKMIPLIAKYRDIEVLLKEDLEKMNELGLLQDGKYVAGISQLLTHYKDNDKIMKLIEFILEGCNLFEELDKETEILLWNSEKTFLASVFFYKKFEKKFQFQIIKIS
jgi:hypothetical protein